MAKRRGNPNWGKPDGGLSTPIITTTSFEEIVKTLHLAPDQYVASAKLKEWARQNCKQRYIPEALLKAWNLDGNSDV
jgi:hypothetical protein